MKCAPPMIYIDTLFRLFCLYACINIYLVILSQLNRSTVNEDGREMLATQH